MKSTVIKIVIFAVGLLGGILVSECFGQSRTDNSVSLVDKEVTYEVPMAYELMHIAMALTDTTIVSNGYNIHNEIIDTSSKYYREVVLYFGKHKNHELIKQLNKSFRKSANNYLSNLQLAYNCTFSKNRIIKNNQFPFIRRIAFSINSVDRKALHNFALDSKFKQFYDEHRDYYNVILRDIQVNANVSEQKNWLEKEFLNRCDSYNIVISPLMYGTHFSTSFTRNRKDKCFMWVSKFENDYKKTPTFNSAKYTGIVMTEIDHNYINPASDNYTIALNEIMGDDNRLKWTNGSFNNSYKTGYKIFNEYMTHSVYLLYTNQKLNDEEQNALEISKITGMENKRKFIQFGKFFEALKQIYIKRKANETITDLYPQIITWCKKENAK